MLLADGHNHLRIECVFNRKSLVYKSVLNGENIQERIGVLWLLLKASWNHPYTDAMVIFTNISVKIA